MGEAQPTDFSDPGSNNISLRRLTITVTKTFVSSHSGRAWQAKQYLTPLVVERKTTDLSGPASNRGLQKAKYLNY